MSKISRLTGRIKHQSSLILNGHILNAPWHSKAARRQKRNRATLDSVMAYLDRYAPAVAGVIPQQPDSPLPEPERAFTIWFQGEENAPALVKACFNSMRRNLSQELIVLDHDSIFNWISLPDFIVSKWRQGKIHNTQFSDICRVELLYRHGGLWFDATDFITAPVPAEIMNQDFFLYMAGSNVRETYALIQSCFIRARKGNPLMGVWRQANHIYWREEDSRINYYILHLLFRLAVSNNPIARKEFDAMPRIDQDATHKLWRQRAEPFSPALYSRLTSDAFFQKTSYKSPGLDRLDPDSLGAHIINS